MRKLISILSLIMASSLLGAQTLSPDVVASAGDSYTSGNLHLDWTLGEIMTETYAGTLVWTQGFHQANDKATSVEDLNANLGNIKVYPNPTTERIFIQREQNGALQLSLLDMRGSMLMQKSVSASSSQLDLSQLPNGIYILRMSDGKQAVKSIRIKKL